MALCEKCKSEIAPSFNVSPLVDLWNDLAHKNLPRVTIISRRRKAVASARLAEHPEKEFWEQVIRKINSSPWLTGQNKYKWIATFDFMVNPNSLAKIMDGNYDRD